MRRLWNSLWMVMAAWLLSSCASSSIKNSSKAPDYTGGPVQKAAILVVEERNMIRQGLENRFRNQMEKQNQGAFVTHELLSLPEIKSDKEVAGTRLREAGADSILIVRLVDSATYNREVRADSRGFAPVTTGFDNYLWYDYYTVAFMDMGTVWGSLEQRVYLDSSLYELAGGKRVWSCLTETVLKENMDRLDEADLLVGKVLAALRKDGMIR